MPCCLLGPALDLNCPWEPLSSPHYHSRRSLQQRYCTLVPPWPHWPAEMVSLSTQCEVCYKPHCGALRGSKGEGRREAMYPLIATEKSEQSSLLVSEIEGSKPQSKWEIGSCSRVTVNMGLCNCGSVLSALVTGSKCLGWAHVWLFLLLS